NAGEMWKSMMAEQLGSTMAEAGGVGIAQQMYDEALQRVRGEESVNAAVNETDRGLAMSWVTDLERRTLGAGADSKN
ncbi:MAG: rod-binding protein, partial [Allorhizobium sp.]